MARRAALRLLPALGLFLTLLTRRASAQSSGFTTALSASCGTAVGAWLTDKSSTCSSSCAHGGTSAAGTACSGCDCTTPLSTVLSTTSSMNTCLGRVLLQDMLSGSYNDQDFSSSCPMCEHRDQCRTLLSELYQSMLAGSDCTKTTSAVNRTDAESKDMTALVIIREQLTFTCNASNTSEYATQQMYGIQQSVAQKYDSSASQYQDYVPGRVFRDVAERTQCKVTAYPCPPGMLCEENKHPQDCPEGYYCPDYAGAKHTCPSGSYCPKGSKEPVECGPLSICAQEGASWPARPVFFLITACIIILQIGVGFLCRRKLNVTSASAESGGDDDNSGVEMVESGVPAAVPSKAPLQSISPDRQLLIEFTNLELVVPPPCCCGPTCACCSRRCCCKCCVGNNQKDITRLAGTTGRIEPGQLTAVMGPSGAGKSTLLGIVSGKLPHTQGTIKVNGMETQLTAFKGTIGFVPQDDIMRGDATVRETLWHSARTRLSSSLSTEEITKRVKNLLETLHLTHVADSVVGTAARRGISGGEKKRVNIGIELIAEPSVLFLDEPTSGLDATSAEDVVRFLKAVAASGVTVVAVVHQPRVEIFDLFDNLMLLGRGGQTVFLGPTPEAGAYFQNLGYSCPEDENLPDFLLDVIAGVVDSSEQPADVPTDVNAETKTTFSSDYTAKQAQIRGKELGSRWSELRADRAGKTGATEAGTQQNLDARSGSRASWCVQFGSFLAQEFRLRYIRSPWAVGDIMAYVVSGLIISIIFGTQPIIIPARPLSYANNCPQDRAGYKCYQPVRSVLGPWGFYVTMGLGIVAASSAVRSMGGPRKLVHWREMSVGVSRTAYWLAVLLADLPAIVVASIAFLAPIVAIVPVRGPEAMYLLWAISVTFAVYGIGYIFSAAFESELAMPTLVGVIIAILFNLFGGYVPKVGDGAYWAYTRNSARALAWIEMGVGYSSEFPDTINSVCETFDRSSTSSYELAQNGCYSYNDVFYSAYDRYVGGSIPNEHQNPNFTLDIALLFAFGIIYRLVSLLLLACVRRDRQR